MNSLLKLPFQSIVILPRHRRKMFEKYNYVPYYEPRPGPRKLDQKPRHKMWNDPQKVWPPIIPPPTNIPNDDILFELEEEERKRSIIMKPF